jgi:hypothetical protein
MNKTDQIAAAVWDRGGQLGIATVFSIETSGQFKNYLNDKKNNLE